MEACALATAFPALAPRPPTPAASQAPAATSDPLAELWALCCRPLMRDFLIGLAVVLAFILLGNTARRKTPSMLTLPTM